MPAIDQYNTTEPIPFFMGTLANPLIGVPGLVPGVSLTVLIGKNSGPLLPPAAAVSETGVGWYKLAPNAVDADTAGTLILNAVGAGCVPTNDLWDVEPAIPPAVPGAPGTGGPVEARLVLGLPAVKTYLRVTSVADDGLIASMMIASKQAADSFMQAPFREKIPTITLTGVVAGDMVQVDGQTYTCMAAAPVAADHEFLIGATDHDTAVNLAALLNSDVEDEDGEPYGCQSATAVVVGDVISLQPEQGLRPVEASGDGVRFIVTRLLTDQPIPEQVAQGCLRWIAHNYEQRADGVAAVGVAGAGSVNWTAPKEALDLWQPYRVYA